MLTPNQDVSMALLTLEEMGLIDYDEEENSFEPTEKGNIDNMWYTEFQKLMSKKGATIRMERGN